ncbi:MAG: 8-amino-7-oxononanoate synthase [Gammaproteobacteria bacterium]|nr:8-amino-7-oxononanoate synthase [Gammaproteobacteria bacterium]
MPGFNDIPASLQARQKQQLYRQRRIVESPQARIIMVNGNELLNLCSNDYLGLANDERVRQAFISGVNTWGAGSGASHLVCGHTRAHHYLEEQLAEFTARPRALMFSSGYAANLGAINALVSAGDAVFEDKLNHASLLDGGLLSRAKFKRFRHKDCNHLNDQLAQMSASDGRKLIVSDGVFSMDGDLCDIDALCQIGADHKAWLMVDDAHGFGVLGDEGRGVVNPTIHSSDDVQVLVGTLGKAFGTQGAFVAGSEELIETLIQNARTFIYTTALPAAVAVATTESLKIVRTEHWRREKLQTLIAQFREGALALGLDLLPSTTPIQPVLMRSEADALQIAQQLEGQGILVTAIRPPTVPAGTSRLRITLTANHTEADVSQLLHALKRAML